MAIDKIYDYAGDLPVYFDPLQRPTSIMVSRGPVKADTHMGLVYWNLKTGAHTNPDGTPYVPPKPTPYEYKFVLAGTRDIDKINEMIDEYFIELRLKKLNEGRD